MWEKTKKHDKTDKIDSCLVKPKPTRLMYTPICHQLRL